MRPDHRKESWKHRAYQRVRVRGGQPPEENAASGWELSRNLAKMFNECAKPEAIRTQGRVTLSWPIDARNKLVAVAGPGLRGEPGETVQVSLRGFDQARSVNLLDPRVFTDREHVVSTIVETLKLLSDRWGGRMEDMLRHCLNALYEYNSHPETGPGEMLCMEDLTGLLERAGPGKQGPAERQEQILERGSDPRTRQWFEAYAKWPPNVAEEASAPLIQKVRENPEAGQARSGQRSMWDLNEMTLAELVPVVLKHTKNWRPNRWRPTAYRMEDGPWTIEVQESGTGYHPIGYRILRDGKLLEESDAVSGSWDEAMRHAQGRARRLAREGKENVKRLQRGLAFERNRTARKKEEAGAKAAAGGN